VSLQDFGPCGEEADEEMMLVGEAGDAQAIGFGALGDIGPVDVHADVGMADLFER